MVILPYNPSLPDRSADELVRYVHAGGKLLVFYVIPNKLFPVLDVENVRHLRAPHPGYFSAIRFADQSLPGAPPMVGQNSWNINVVKPTPGGRVLGEWIDDHGQPTGEAAVLSSSNGMVMTHVLLNDDLANKRRMLLAMVGHLVPEVWQQAARASIDRVGVLGSFGSFQEAQAGILQISHQEPKVKRALDEAHRQVESAQQLLSKNRCAEAMKTATDAAEKVKEAFCLAQQPLPGEFRAFWCHNASGVAGMTWDEAIHRLADNGFTAIFPNMLWGGAAYYPSKVLPVAAAVAEHGDQIAQCLAACRKYGLQMHVWKVNWNLGHAVPKAFVEKMRQAGRLQVNSRGEEENWLCPSHPENQKLEIESMLEIVRNYGVDGIHFDYIRYPDSDHCFCAGCRQRFQEQAHVTVQYWPKDVLAGGRLRPQWLDWRRGNITAVVRAVSEQARVINPKIKLSAAVFRHWSTDRDSVGQDWKLWCDKGYLDFVCPMDYTPSNRSFESMVTQQLEWAGRTPCYPGIGVSASSSHFGVDRLIEQIGITRRHQTHGFIIFNYGVRESRDLLPMLGLGITAKR